MKTIATLLTATVVALVGARHATAQGHPASHEIPAYATVTKLTGAHRPPIAGLQDYTCFGYQLGWIFTKDTADMKHVAENIQGGADAFERLFGKKPTRGALILLGAESVQGSVDSTGALQTHVNMAPPPHAEPALKAAGAHWVLALTTNAAYRAVVSQMLIQAKAPPQEVTKMLDNLMAEDEGLMRHELGHQWSYSTYWPDQQTSIKGRLVADWLEESAAVLVESPQLIRERMQQLLQAYHADPHTRTIVPLDTLFVMRHPNENSLWPKGDTVNGIDRRKVMWYEECRGVINFLLEHSGKGQPIFGSIADGAVRGETMAQWLRANGARYGLPTTVHALDVEWRRWLGKQKEN